MGMNVLVACEESQRVCIAFRDKGHNAFSCDIQEPSGGHPIRRKENGHDKTRNDGFERFKLPKQ